MLKFKIVRVLQEIERDCFKLFRNRKVRLDAGYTDERVCLRSNMRAKVCMHISIPFRLLNFGLTGMVPSSQSVGKGWPSDR